MKTRLFIFVFTLLTVASCYGQFGEKYKPNFSPETLTNADTAYFYLSTNSLRRQFTQNYDLAGVIKRTELTGTNLAYSIKIQDNFTGGSGTDWFTTKTITLDTVGASQLINLANYTTYGDRSRIEVVQTGTGTARFDPQFILWLRRNGLY